MAVNKEATRYFSDRQEKKICRELGGRQTANSGAGRFTKGDVIVEDASLLIEAKTVMSEKKSVSVKKEWIDKNKQEAFQNRLDYSAVCINFEPDGDNYFVINSGLMQYLVSKLVEEREVL